METAQNGPKPTKFSEFRNWREKSYPEVGRYAAPWGCNHLVNKCPTAICKMSICTEAVTLQSTARKCRTLIFGIQILIPTEFRQYVNSTAKHLPLLTELRRVFLSSEFRSLLPADSRLALSRL